MVTMFNMVISPIEPDELSKLRTAGSSPRRAALTSGDVAAGGYAQWPPGAQSDELAACSGCSALDGRGPGWEVQRESLRTDAGTVLLSSLRIGRRLAIILDGLQSETGR